jgi:hypothetical protein
MDNATLKDVADVLRHCAARSHVTEDCQALLGAANVVDGYALKLNAAVNDSEHYRKLYNTGQIVLKESIEERDRVNHLLDDTQTKLDDALSRLSACEKERDAYTNAYAEQTRQLHDATLRLDQCSKLASEWRKLSAEDCVLADEPHGPVIQRAMRDCGQQLGLVLSGICTVGVERQEPNDARWESPATGKKYTVKPVEKLHDMTQAEQDVMRRALRNSVEIVDCTHGGEVGYFNDKPYCKDCGAELPRV